MCIKSKPSKEAMKMSKEVRKGKDVRPQVAELESARPQIGLTQAQAVKVSSPTKLGQVNFGI